MIDMHKLWREPLVHFLLIGVALFVAFGLTQEQDGNAQNHIVVDASQVEQLVAQFKRTWMRAPTEDELALLIESHVRDEVYYREAVAMGLDQNDPQVRRRMRLKLEFLLEDLTAEEADDEVLTEFLQQHPDKFQVAPRVSFLQLYLNPDKHQDLASDAQAMLARLEQGVAPDSVGDATMVPFEYTLVTQTEIARSFGEALARQVLTLEPGDWTGPLYSGLGGHLVKVTERIEGYLPELTEIRAQVERDYQAQRRQELKDMAYQKLRAGYEVVIQPSATAEDPLTKSAGGAVAATGPEQARP